MKEKIPVSFPEYREEADQRKLLESVRPGTLEWFLTTDWLYWPVIAGLAAITLLGFLAMIAR